MPNRVIKESINESKGLSEVSFFAADLYKRLITYADDYGRFNADCQILLARLYPRELGVVTVEDIDDALTELIGVGKIGIYTTTVKKEVYGAFPHWGDHQRLRESRKKNPDPENTDVNDWYLRRFISKDMKIRIIERDHFKCQICGKYVCSGNVPAERLVKMGTGLFHFDHIVPVQQGGRATLENLRLTCPKCNLERKRFYKEEDIFELPFASCENSPQVAASCGLNPNPNPNPIQSEKESEGADARDVVIKKWNSLGLGTVRNAKGTRETHLKARIEENGLATVLEAIDNVSRSDFLQGKNDRGWKITFDWFLNQNNFQKVLEGNYDSKSKKASKETDLDELLRGLDNI